LGFDLPLDHREPERRESRRLSSVKDSRVTFDAAGPAGMKIEGTTSDLSVVDDGGNVVITVPLANLSTGIGLRDHHMKEKYLEVPKYPAATLTIARNALKFPHDGERASPRFPGQSNFTGRLDLSPSTTRPRAPGRRTTRVAASTST